MSEGMEAISEIISLVRFSNPTASDWAQGVDKCITILRSHGWLHEDDKVENTEWEVRCPLEPSGNDPCKAETCPDGWSEDNECKKYRPALVREILKGKI